MTSFMMTGTTAGAIAATLTDLRHKMGAPTLGMVLTLVVVAEEAEHYDAMCAATGAGREHPCRILIVIPRSTDEETRLDAEIRVEESTPGEIVIVRLYGELREHAESVVSPLLLPDIPVVAWWPGRGPSVPAKDRVGVLGQRRITDAAASTRPLERIAARAEGYVRGDTDFAWTRLTPWRSLLAAVFDQPVGQVTHGVVEASPGNPSAVLLAAWLTERLGVPIEVVEAEGPGITAVRLREQEGEIAITRSDGRLGTLSRTGQPDRRVALARRNQAELLAEELRRLDPDDVYEAAIRHLSRKGAP